MRTTNHCSTTHSMDTYDVSLLLALVADQSLSTFGTVLTQMAIGIAVKALDIAGFAVARKMVGTSAPVANDSPR